MKFKKARVKFECVDKRIIEADGYTNGVYNIINIPRMGIMCSKRVNQFYVVDENGKELYKTRYLKDAKETANKMVK